MEEDGITTTRLMAFIILFMLTGAASAIMLYRRDPESRRLLQIDKLWGRVKQDEGMQLRKIKRNLVLGYSSFLIISVVMLMYYLFKLSKQLGWI